MNKTHTGIWLDYKEAYIVTIDEYAQVTTQHLVSEVEHLAVKGGVRSKTPWGPQYSPHDRSTLEREKHAEGHYFEEIIENIHPETDSIVIFGPAEAKIGLKKAIGEIKHYKPELRDVLTAGYLSQNEIVALVRNYFKNPGDFK